MGPLDNGLGPGGMRMQQPHYLMFSGPPAPRFNNAGPHIFYVDPQRQASTPPAVQESAKVRNHANLLKHTLTLQPTGEPHRYCVAFRCDTAVPTVVHVYFCATERPDPDSPEASGVVFVCEARCSSSPPPVEIPAETDYSFTSPDACPFDVRRCAEGLVYTLDRPHVYPIIIALTYQMPPSDPIPEEEEEGEEASRPFSDHPSSSSQSQSQYTYAEVYRGEDDTLRLRCLRQRLQLGDGSLFELEDIYGVVGEEHHAHAGGLVVGAAVTPADAVTVEGEECVICLANDRDTTVMPCRHMCLCGECAEVLRRQTNKCPICRTLIECLMTLKKD